MSLKMLPGLALGLILSAADAKAADGIDLSTLTFLSGDEGWKNLALMSEEAVDSIADAGNQLTQLGYEALDLEHGTPMARGLYLLTAGQVNTRLTWAASILYGHEYAHFQHSERFGFTRHFFYDRDEGLGSRISNRDAFWQIFLTGQVGGPARSESDDPGVFNTPLYKEEGITKSLAGLNWQMNYSESWAREQIFDEQYSAFDAPGFVMNRLYTMGYSFGSLSELNPAFGSNEGGDTGKFAAHLEKDIGVSNANEKMLGLSIISNLLSPQVLNALGSFSSYISQGDVTQSVEMKETRFGRVTWDIPQYLNLGNMSVSPTIYWKPSSDQTPPFQADDIMVGLGFETPVLGEGQGEFHAYLSGRWDKLSIENDLTVGVDGLFSEISASYSFKPHMDLTVGYAGGSGTTMRESRLFPLGSNTAWVGGRITF